MRKPQANRDVASSANIGNRAGTARRKRGWRGPENLRRWRASNKRPFVFGRVLSRADIARWAGIRGVEVVRQEAHAIENWSDFRFSTSDKRTFALFLDGESILKRLDAAGVWLNRADAESVERIKGLAGFILEIRSDEPPLVFDDDAHLARAWAETHRAFGVAPSDEELEAFDLPDLWGDEEEQIELGCEE